MYRFALGTLLMAALSSAASISYTGSITGPDTFNRPVDLGSLSPVGTAVFYDARTISIAGAGNYTFDVIEPTNVTPGDDTVLLVYSSFNPAAPLTNLLGLNDDKGGGDFKSRIQALVLTAGQYVVVTTTFNNGATGTYTMQIEGPDEISLVGVPEPATVLLSAAGLGLIALRRRRAA